MQTSASVRNMSLISDFKDWLNLEKQDSNAGMEKEAGATRIFYATDIHGSTVCWRKFVNSAEFYSADVLVLGGDTTGKAIMPIIDEGDRYTYTRDGEEHVVEDKEELEEQKEVFANRGYYWYVFDEEEYEELKRAENSEERQDEIFIQQMKARIREWIDFAEGRLPDDVPVFVCPGNDDPFEIDPVWRESDAITFGEGEPFEIDDDYAMVSCGWTNPTPWNTDREEPEDELRERLEGMIAEVGDTDRCIFNFHAPPYDSGLDEAPELDDDLRPKFGGQTTEPVGSKAVRDAIEEHQPPLSLHGHVHESRGKTQVGETWAINPGSVYSEGSVQGAIIDLHPKVDVVGLIRG